MKPAAAHTAVDVRPISDSAAQIESTEQDTCPQAPEQNQVLVSARTLLFASTDLLPPITVADIAGQTLGLRIADPANLGFSTGPFGFPGDLLRFNGDGTGTTRALPLTFTWTLTDDGELIVNLSNGVEARFRKLREIVNGIDLYYSEHADANARRSIQQPAYRANGALSFTPATVVGTHYSDGIGSVFPLETVDFIRTATQQEINLLKGFAIEVFDTGLFDQQGDRLETDANGQVVRVFFPMRNFDSGRYWRVQPDGSLLFRTYLRFDEATGFQSLGDGCGFDGTEAGCYVAVERFVEPYFLHGNRQGWFERLRSFRVATGELILEEFRTIIYVRRPNGDWALPREPG